MQMGSFDVVGSGAGREEATSRNRESENAKPLLVRPKNAWRMLGCGNTHGYQLLAAGQLDSFLDGHSRKITVESIHRYIERRLSEQQGGRGRGAHHECGTLAQAIPHHHASRRLRRCF
jgi:hypothetical protein